MCGSHRCGVRRTQDVILHNSRRKYFVRVLTYLDVYALSKDSLEEILEVRRVRSCNLGSERCRGHAITPAAVASWCVHVGIVPSEWGLSIHVQNNPTSRNSPGPYSRAVPH